MSYVACSTYAPVMPYVPVPRVSKNEKIVIRVIIFIVKHVSDSRGPALDNQQARETDEKCTEGNRY